MSVLCVIQFNSISVHPPLIINQMDNMRHLNSIILVIDLDVLSLIFDGQLKSFQLHPANQSCMLPHVVENCTAVNRGGYVNMHPISFMICYVMIILKCDDLDA